MQREKATGLESTDSPQGTIPTASTTCHHPPSEEEALLRWAEERLKGQYGECSYCEGDGWDPYKESECEFCEGEGTCAREDYLDAERALTIEQRVVVGEDQLLLFVHSSKAEVFQLASEDDENG